MDECTKIYRGFTNSMDEAFKKAKEITDQLDWIESDAVVYDVFISLREPELIRLDGYKYCYLIKIVL